MQAYFGALRVAKYISFKNVYNFEPKLELRLIT